ncbi:MAG: hypothetical protein FWC91_00755 [Defluviitaleaceae bacterium]|nr:hypothetical protein [Defluviitaleaceae bacterium]
MVQFIAGGKGEGKTKLLIDKANQQLKSTDGNLVFIDDDRRTTSDLHYSIRFIEAGRGVLSNYREFAGFVLGILAMDSDIKTVYIDGLTNILETLDADCLVKLAKRLKVLSEKNDVEFIICVNWKKDEFPQEIADLCS